MHDSQRQVWRTKPKCMLDVQMFRASTKSGVNRPIILHEHMLESSLAVVHPYLAQINTLYVETNITVTTSSLQIEHIANTLLCCNFRYKAPLLQNPCNSTWPGVLRVLRYRVGTLWPTRIRLIWS